MVKKILCACVLACILQGCVGLVAGGAVGAASGTVLYDQRNIKTMIQDDNISYAISKKLNNDDRIVYSLHGDGELQEGQIWEAAMYATANKIDNLISTVDYNGRQIDGDVDDVVPLGDLKAKWLAFGWDVMEMNGNDLEEVIATLQEAKTRTGKGKPIIILMKTEMGQGVDFMMGSHRWHGIAPNDGQLADALSQLEETLGDY